MKFDLITVRVSNWSDVSFGDLYLVHWTVIFVRVYQSDALNNFHTGRDAAEYGVLAIKPFARR